MDAPEYVPARVKSFLSSVYVGHVSNFNTHSYVERIKRQNKTIMYQRSLPIDPNSFFEEVLKEGEVSNKERGLIESVWLNEGFPIDISEPALEIFQRLVKSKRVRKKLNSILD